MMHSFIDEDNWEKHIEFYQNYEAIPEPDKQILIESIKFLKREFGKNFLLTSDYRNPIKDKFSHRTEYAWRDLIRIADGLRTFKSYDSNYDKLLGKIKSPTKSRSEGIPFFDIGLVFNKVGFKIKFEPIILKEKKRPDIQVFGSETNQDFFIEVSKLNNSNPVEEISRNYYAIRDSIHGIYSPYFSGKIFYESIEKSKLNSLRKQVFEASKIAIEKNEFVILSKSETDGILELGLAGDDNIDKLKSWISSNNYGWLELRSPSLNFDYTPRIIQKIAKEIRQIPQNSFGLIYIPVEPLYLELFNPIEITKKIQFEMNKYENLLGVCISTALIGGKNENLSTRFDKFHFYSDKTYYNCFRKLTLFSYNEKNSINMSLDTLSKTYQAFEIL